MPNVHALLVTYRRPELLQEVLAAVGSQTTPPSTLFVLDNGVDPGVEAIVRGSPHIEAQYVPMPDNLGPAGAIAVGLELVLPRAAPDDWILLLDDNDPPWRDDLLEDLLDFAEERCRQDPSIGAVGIDGACINRRTGLLHKNEDGSEDGAIRVDYLFSGYLPLYRVEAVRNVGPFDRDLFFGFEELEFGLRLASSGYRVLVAADLQAAANASVTPLRRERNVLSKSPGNTAIQWRRYYNHRNLLRIYARYRLWRPLFVVAVAFPLGALGRSLLRSPREIGQLTRTYARASLDASLGRLGRRVEVPW